VDVGAMIRNRTLLLTTLLLVLPACGKDEHKEPTAEGTAEAPAPERPRAPEAAGARRGLLIGLARFAVENGRATASPLPARAELLYQENGEWKITGFEDPESNVFHKVMPYRDASGKESVLTFGGMAASVKRWSLKDGKLVPETLWTEDFGGKYNRMRDAEIGDLDRTGKPVIAIATHDQGIVALLRDAGSKHEVEKIDAETNTFVHEIEIGDLDGDGTLEVYATPSEPNRLNAEQSGKVVRYVPKRGEGRVVVADLGQRHAKEIYVGDIDGDGKDELYVAVEAKTSGAGANLVIQEPVEIRRYLADTPANAGTVVASIPDRFTRFLTMGTPEVGGKRVMVAAAFRSGLWLLTPRAGEKWTIENFDRDSSGFEHAAIFADLDGDGADELYVAADDQRQIRRYVWRDGKPVREVIYEREGPPGATMTWNLMPADVSLVVPR
jgi:hypothetical protein